MAATNETGCKFISC